ncbi:MAG: hypothetical protein A3A80_01425 [Candidatus Terrybacteria bacterium RIFCSPLOWO2_01_FULL_44_24]|uniref:DNA polymerase III subunit delta n=1 Tax=Candidatus Terrybacteria bacterium RIFCSPHIGHO2_01_FULL_43_35 TaxID=1802361 RepID=A0A1G2PFE9_9BACT|nr:MAG: hypothetical protein A2828_03800 [Candidatus Terrybacteria bacterium RIFCSPHIGHO2_01_FULL_43_35]OHA49938.1 MAG: hypothetical protein A3B75_03500 [Candidatus Terrybacteria bacterium RIFCSPHIGHO2_02_FULL_43_14]OHA51741.1 MAG: hypothetical protein A3A80_01425 [Candidatus Terrybacteria bacterium RIFCSPLOWO2_01_FULL_44_24]
MFGHEKVITYLDRLIQKDKLAHAYAFCGPENVGKRSTAIYIAQNIFCADAMDVLHDRIKCSICFAITQGNHKNVILLDPEAAAGKLNISISVIRKLRQSLILKEMEGRKRIIIIDGAEYMNNEAANAFLKVLEEPRSHIHFFLMCGSQSALMSTIVSRLQCVRFNTVSNVKIETALIDYGLSAKIAREYTHLSYGRPGRAISFVKNPALFMRAQEEAKHAHYLISDFITERMKLITSLSGETNDAYAQLNSWLLALAKILEDQTKNGDSRSQSTARRIKDLLAAARLLNSTNINLRLALEKIIFSF